MSDIAQIERPNAPGIYKPIASPSEIVSAHDGFRQMFEKALTPGIDYGVLPGTSKPTLLKPGAERLLLAAGLYAGDIEILEQSIDPYIKIEWVKRRWDERSRSKVAVEGSSFGYWRFVVRVGIYERSTANRVGEAVASCSSMEDKYIENPRDTEHTGLAMAIKRAITAATQRTLALSGLFGEDDEAANVLHPRHNTRKRSLGNPETSAVKVQKSQTTIQLESHLVGIMGFDQAHASKIIRDAIRILGKSETPAAILACQSQREIEQLIGEQIDG